MKKLLYSVSMCICILFLLSCASSAKPKEVDPNFLGDFAPIELGSVMSVHFSFGKIKPREIKAYFVPRQNTVELWFSDYVNKVAVLLNYDNRQMIIQSGSEYLEKYTQDALEVREPNKKNAFATGKVPLSWGVTAAARDTKTGFYTNYTYLEAKKPYFLMHFEPSADVTDSTVYSPAVDVYFSPTQLEFLFEILNQEYLLGLLKEKEEAFLVF